VEKDFNHHRDSLNIRNKYVDDMRGQHTGYKTRYTEHLIGIIDRFNHHHPSGTQAGTRLRRTGIRSGAQEEAIHHRGDLICHF
jgi:hypothetical protein